MQKLCTLTLAFLLSLTFSVQAQDTEAEVIDETAEVEAEVEESAPLTISGSVDAYFRTVFGAERDWAPNTAFVNNSGFGIGMVNLVVAKEGEKAGFVGDLVFGPRGDAAVFISSDPTSPLHGGTGNTAIVNQLYAYVKPTESLTLAIGNFNTYLGYEVISPVGNFNYTTSYMFSWGPFSHTGVRADYAINDQFTAMVSLMNPTDFTNFNPVNTYSLGAQLGYSGDKGAAYLNVLYGDQDGSLETGDLGAEDFVGGEVISQKPLLQVDLTTGFNLTDAFYLGLNTTYNATTGVNVYTSDGGSVEETEVNDSFGFYGVALYPQYSFTDNFALGLRGEYFSEFEGGYGVIGGYDDDGAASVVALTLSGNVKVGNLTFIPEIRYDSFSEDVVPTEDGAESGAFSALVAAVYAF